MSKNKFDDLLLKRFQEEELEYKPESWNKLAQKLPNKKKRLFLVPIGIAAAIALILGSVLLFNNYETQNIPESRSFTQLKVEEKSIIEPKNEEPKNDAKINRITAKNKTTKTSLLANNNKKNNHTPSSIIPKKTIIYPSVPKVKEESKTLAKANKDGEINNIVSENNTGIYPKKDIKIWESPKQNRHANANSRPDYWAKKNNKKETSIGVAGGVNYGSLNTGYAVGLSAKQGLGKDFFIDGTIAVMYNNNANNLGNYAGKTSGRPASGSINMTSPAFSPAQNLYYVQFNPSFGYQVEKDIALSMGADIQKLVTNDEHTNKVKFTQNGLETIPNVDFGFTGKAEINVGPNIKTGIIFREGLNSIFGSKDISYVNRRYFQVQFKYNIPLK